MAYSADSFTALEIPTLAKMNKLWSNDASFNDGTGIADNAIIQRHLADGVVGAPELKAGSTLLGFIGVTSGDTTYPNAVWTDMTGLTGLSITTTKPNQQVLFLISAQSYGAAGRWTVAIDGTDQTSKMKKVGFGPTTTASQSVWIIATIAAAGVHTIKARAYSDGAGHRIIHSEGEGLLAAFAIH